MTKQQKPVVPLVLAILDGWGRSPQKLKNNPLLIAKTPFLKEVEKNYPSALLAASGSAVGLPKNQDGNSEAGHMNIGAGRIVDQDAVIINKSIANGSFFRNKALRSAFQHVKKNRSSLHLMGLLSNYNSGHVSPDHLITLLKMAERAKFKKIFIHFFTDGRDSARYDALKFIQEVKKNFQNGEVVSTITGRFYAMDRKKNWSVTEQTYNLLTQGKGLSDKSVEDAIRHAYNRGESDEFIKPTYLKTAGRSSGLIGDNDAVIFFNLRSDRARQLTKPFVQSRFEEINPGAFKRQKVLKNLCFVALTDFGPDLGNTLTAYPSENIKGTLPMALKRFRQFYIAESEKFAHVTYFFNGGYDQPIAAEGRLVIPSVNVMSYDKKPDMSAKEITKEVVRVLRNKKYDFITLNFANPDMVGHTGNTKACIIAMETVDKCLARIGHEVAKHHGGMLITADHGNVEETVNSKTGEVDTEHSTNPVPCLLYQVDWRDRCFKKKQGVLGDIAPTILSLMKVPRPKEMTRPGLLS
ncbi:2,3-bisphosphoglycerate-independent phosphoglycerate mutase [Patescibacteria group bacterium]|nr:2,3-bisphosphoglycerate-independent phosphoglycerate mutase [Patescibacteria group bacterium]